MPQTNAVPPIDDPSPAPPLPPEELAIYRRVIQLWLVLCLLTLGAGLLSYVFGFATLLWD